MGFGGSRVKGGLRAPLPIRFLGCSLHSNAVRRVECRRVAGYCSRSTCINGARRQSVVCVVAERRLLERTYSKPKATRTLRKVTAATKQSSTKVPGAGATSSFEQRSTAAALDAGATPRFPEPREAKPAPAPKTLLLRLELEGRKRPRLLFPKQSALPAPRAAMKRRAHGRKDGSASRISIARCS